MIVPLGRLAAGSSAESAPGASPEANCHEDVSAAASFFLFFDPLSSGAPDSVDSLAVLTIDHPPADVEEAAGATVWAGASGSAGLGAGVQAGSLGAIGVGSGAGRKGSGAGGGGV